MDSAALAEARPRCEVTVNSNPTNSVSLTWADPTVTGTQLPLLLLQIWENDLTQVPPTQTLVGSVDPGVEEWSSGYVLPPGAERTYQVGAVDTANRPGPLSPASNEVDVSGPGSHDLPSAPGAPTATLNP